MEYFYPVLKTYRAETEIYENLLLNPDAEITKQYASKILNKLLALKRHIVILTKWIYQTAKVYQIIRKKIFYYDFKHGIHLYFGDIQEHTVSLKQNIIYLEESMSRTHKAYKDFLAIKTIKDNQLRFKRMVKITQFSSSVSSILLITVVFGINTNIPDQSFTGKGAGITFFKIFISALCIASMISLGVGKFVSYKLKN